MVNFLQSFGRYFAKNARNCGHCHFSEDKLHLTDFQHFLVKFWHVFGKKEVRLLEFRFSFSSEFWDKDRTKTKIGGKLDINQPKSAEKSRS